MIIAEIVSDNVAVAVRLRGFVAFLKECQDSCSITQACIENMRSAFEFFEKSPSEYLDEAVS